MRTVFLLSLAGGSCKARGMRQPHTDDETHTLESGELHQLELEDQILAGQWMIAVDLDLLIVELHDREAQSLSLGSLGVKDYALGKLDVVVKLGLQRAHRLPSAFHRERRV